MSFEKLYEENKFAEAEKTLAETSKSDLTEVINQTSVVSNLVLGKKIEKAVVRLIVSNKKVAKSNEIHSQVNLFISFVVLVVIISEYQLQVQEANFLTDQRRFLLKLLPALIGSCVTIFVIYAFYHSEKFIPSRLQGFFKKLWPWKRGP